MEVNEKIKLENMLSHTQGKMFIFDNSTEFVFQACENIEHKYAG